MHGVGTSQGQFRDYFGVGDHFGLRIISGSIWGLFWGWGSLRGRDHLGVNLGIISGLRSSRGRFGDYFGVGDHCGVGIISCQFGDYFGVGNHCGVGIISGSIWGLFRD